MSSAGKRSFKWVQPVTYPLFFAVGAGIVACGTIMSRKLLHDPAVTMWRSQRGVDATEEQGTKYRNSALQRMVSGRPHHIIPDQWGQARASEAQAQAAQRR